MICPFCGREAVWCENKAIYGRNFGKSYMCYFCKPCNAYVGCHQNTRVPLGTMANAELRAWRMKAHAHVDPIWRSGQMTRRQLYRRLKEIFGRQIHIAESDVEQCRQILEIKF
jgi:hypothetical protein